MLLCIYYEAIYLAKRSLRSQQKYGLNEHEQVLNEFILQLFIEWQTLANLHLLEKLRGEGDKRQLWRGDESKCH